MATVTVLAVNLGFLISGTVIVEVVFSIPGLGSLIVSQVQTRDFPTVQALTLIFGDDRDRDQLRDRPPLRDRRPARAEGALKVSAAGHEHAALARPHRLRRTIVVERCWANASALARRGILTAYVLAAILAPWIAPHDPTAQDLLNTFQRPSRHHLMGTDQYGSDVFSRVLYGLRVDLVFGVVTTYIPMVIGMLVGAWAGYHRGIRDSFVMRLADLTIAMPFIVLVLAIVAIVGPGLEGAVHRHHDRLLGAVRAADPRRR